MLEADANLNLAKEVEGYKVLPPCVLYGKIGQGGMGAVYRGRHLNLDIDVAVKCLKPDLTGEDEQFVVRFRREARSAARINHQNVVRVFDVSEEQGLHYIVMELVQGETARQRVKRKGHLGVGEALEIMHGAAAGLGEAHSKGFIHRDIKPDNIMIASTGTVKVADLGLAKPSGKSNMSMVSGTNLIMGTPQYMPPEQWENTATVTPAADIWALGATLYYMLVGGEAFGSESLPRIMQRIVLHDFPDVREKRPDVPDDVAEFIKKATQKAPEDRFPDALAMVEAIDALGTRRETLRNNAVVSEKDQNTLLSPPPAKTLAKIKFWLDGQTQAGGESADFEKQTLVSPGSRRPAAPQPQGVAPKGRGGLWALVALLLVAAGVLGVWQPWRSVAGSPFAQVERMARAGQYAAAVAEAIIVYDTNGSLSQAELDGKAERLAQLHLSWAQQARDAEDWRLCLEQLASSSELAASPTADDLKQAVLAEAAQAVDAELQRIVPGDIVLQDDTSKPTLFRGRLTATLAKELKIAGEPVDLQSEGLFAVTRVLAGATSVPVEVVLVTGDEVRLQPWTFVYAGTTKREPDPAPVAKTTGQPTGDPVIKPLVVEKDPIAKAPIRKEPVVKADFQAEPAEVKVLGDAASALTIRAPKGAIIRIDGLAVERDRNGAAYVHNVRSDLDVPVGVKVEVSLNGTVAAREIPVVREPIALAVVQKANAVGLVHQQKGRWATDKASVQLVGALDRPATSITVNGKKATGVTWQGTVFTMTWPLQPGANNLAIIAERESWLPVTQDVQIDRISNPRLVVAEETRVRDKVGGGRYRLVFDTDAWTRSVLVGNGTDVVRLQRDPNTHRFRGQMTLKPGANQLVAQAINLLGKNSRLSLDITFQASAVKAEIRAVRVMVNGEQEQVRAGRQVFLSAEKPLIVDATDSTAIVRINEQIVARSPDGTVPLTGLLQESKATRIELVLENGLGRSDVFSFFAWVDSTLPAAQVTEPSSLAVARGKAFVLSGKWQDGGGLVEKECKLGDLRVRLSPRGVTKQGTWTIEHPGLAKTTTLNVEFVDRAGNRTTLPVKITVR